MPDCPRRLWTLLAFAVLIARGLAAPAPDPGAAFDQANKLYEQGRFEDAAKAYAALLQSGPKSAALHFNLGNACFKAGHLGQAIVQYRLAERLDARDPDIRANLRFARSSVAGGAAGKPPAWQRWLPPLTLNEWALAASGSFWVLLLLLAAGQFRPAWRFALKRVSLLATLATALLIGGLAWSFKGTVGNQSAVVIERDVIMRHGPLDESPSLQTLSDGQELIVVDQKDDWLQVEGATRGTGWVKRGQVARLGR